MTGNDCKSYGNVTHVIFDMDGLLIDTERIYTKIMDAICSKHDKQFTFDLKVKMMGRSGEAAAQIAIDELQLPITVEEYLLAAKQLKEKWFGQCELLPGALKLVQHLHMCGVPIALASGSFHRDYLTKTERHQSMFELFHHRVFGDDSEVKHGKPNPDVFLVTAARFDSVPKEPSNTVVFEDAPNGVAAAKAAGMKVVMVPDERLDKSFTEKADLVLKSLEDFQPELWGLPPYKV